jgi:DNA-binding transcriptional ArsR family regulator
MGAEDKRCDTGDDQQDGDRDRRGDQPAAHVADVDTIAPTGTQPRSGWSNLSTVLLKLFHRSTPMECTIDLMPVETGRPTCRGVVPSAPSELAWILNLLTQTARYAVPALAELDGSLLPGVSRLRAPMLERSRRLWADGVPGCPELLPLAYLGGCVLDDGLARFLAWLEVARVQGALRLDLLTESPSDRPAVLERIRRVRADAGLRHEYRGLLVDAWRPAADVWERQGRAAVLAAGAGWTARLESGTPIEELVPPRHPLTRAEQLGYEDLFEHRSEFAVSPMYFCMSGGHVVDLNEFVHIGVPASDLLPVRKVRDASFVAYRLRVLAEPTRVHILIQLLSAPAGVMELSRGLRISQPTVSGHVKVLRDAGLIQPRRFGGRSVFVASRKRIERLLEDARATIARWD